MCDSHFQVVRKQNCTLTKACRQSWELQMHNKLTLGGFKLMLASAEGGVLCRKGFFLSLPFTIRVLYIYTLCQSGVQQIKKYS